MHQTWTFVATFPDKPAAAAAIAMEKCWSYYYENNAASGRRVSYRCNAVKFRSKKQCPAAVYLRYHSENSDISMYRSTSDHKHDEEEADIVFKFDAEQETLIREMFKQNLKPKSIKLALVEKGHPAPPQSKLNSFLRTLRAAKYGKEKLHMGTLEAWLIQNTIAPQDELDPFVAHFEIESADSFAPKFR